MPDWIKYMQGNIQLVFQRIYWQSLNKNTEIQSLVWALILSTIFFSPYLFTANPQFNFFGDVAILYFPQFVEGYHMARSGALTGIDFLTSNGSTTYFLRPNIPVYYPPYQLTYLLFHFETIEELARAFVFIAYAHSVLAAYYCMRIGRKYFQMDHGTSLLFSVLYFGAISYYAFTAPPFYYVAALFPFLLYFALQSVEKPGWWRLSLHSFPYAMVFLSGYLPLDVNAVLIALLFAVVYFWQNKNDETKNFGLLLIKLLAPVALASVIVLTLYLAMFLYHKQVPGVAEGVWHSAHQFSFESKDIFALLSRSFPSSNPGTGTPFVRLGLAPVFILVLAYSQRKKLAITPSDAKIIALSLLIFSFYLLLAFGQASGLPDLFYFMVPVIGKMHLYGRYLLIASFFFYLAVAISFKYLVQIRGELRIGRWLAVLFLIMFAAEGYIQISHPEWINLKLLVIELLMIGLMLIALTAKQNFYAFAGVIGVSFFIHAANFNSYTNSFNQVAVGPYKNDVAFSPERRESMNNYFKQNSNKYLIKYVDITSGIEKPNGVMLNFPWMARDKLKLSNYMGYEPHMAVDRDYMTKFPYPYYGKINVPWLLRTGADFVIYDQAAWVIISAELEQWIDKNVPELDLWYGYKAAKLKDASGLVEYIPNRNKGDFDNGIVRVSNASGTAIVTGFETDFVSHVHFQVESTSSVMVRYALFPNKMMELRVNGERSDVILKDGLLEFSLPPGQHLVEYKYKNPLHQSFIIVYLVYLIYLISIIGWRGWMEFRSFRLKQQNKAGV
ncbi:MAG: hypothetical protein LT080_11845 [Thiobacillus sp.]|nr:hypothetical protein [Thiobacillus sp.]